MTNEVLFKLEDVKKYFPIKEGMLKKSKNYVKAVDGISLDIFSGETLGIVGESGSGKSTFGRTILGLESLTSGKMEFKGIDVTKLTSSQRQNIKKEMQMIFQDPYASLNPKQRIGKAIEEPMVIHTNLSRQERYERAVALLEEVGLGEEHYSRFPHEFSGGQRQRIGIARALAIEPEFIVCDEPTSALDVSIQAQVLTLLKNLQRKKNLTYLFISHDLGVVRHICDRVLVMYLGRPVELAPVEQLIKNPQHPYTKVLLSAVPRPVVSDQKPKRLKLEDFPELQNFTAKEYDWKEVGDNHYVAC